MRTVPVRNTDYAYRKIGINRNRVSQTDGLVDVVLDGRSYSASEATNVLICNRFENVLRFPYYCWCSDGIFRHGDGTFRWYFLLSGEMISEDTWAMPRVLQVKFEECIDFEHDTPKRIREGLRNRLNIIENELLAYNGEIIHKNCDIMKKVFNKDIKFRL